MKYTPIDEKIPQERRQELNEKILYLINSGRAAEYGITKEHVYNGYTGSGGLHGLKRSEYDSYSEYSKGKKEVENGQFFTPGNLPVYRRYLIPSKRGFGCGPDLRRGELFQFLFI